MRIAVIGATRGIGACLVDQARTAGHDVTAVGRSLDLAPAPDLDVVQGSITDPAITARAVEKADAVAWCAGGTDFGPAWLKRVTWMSEGTRLLVGAMRSRGVRRLVAVTGVGAGDSRGHGGLLYDRILQPLALGAIYADKDRQEALIRDSGLDWTIVRPGLLHDGPPWRRYRTVTDLAGVTAGRISRADCADFILRSLTEDRWVAQTVLITD